jgi:hypothetical protein
MPRCHGLRGSAKETFTLVFRGSFLCARTVPGVSEAQPCDDLGEQIAARHL